MSKSRQGHRGPWFDGWTLSGLFAKVQRRLDEMNDEAREKGLPTRSKHRNYALSRARNCGSNYF